MATATRVLMLAVAMLASAIAGASAAEVCASLPARQPMPREAKAENLVDQHWLERTTKIEQQLPQPDTGRAQLLFLGDSITQYWAPAVFDNFYAGRAALNLGVTGDYTQGLLWRLARMPMGGALRPRLAVVLIGTNNTASGSRPEDTALGIAEVVRTIRRRSPQTRVLLLGLLPRGAQATDPLRIVNERVNALIASCADNRDVFYAAPGAMLPDRSGRLSEQIAFDSLHLTWLGYAILSTALEPDIRRLLGD